METELIAIVAALLLPYVLTYVSWRKSAAPPTLIKLLETTVSVVFWNFCISFFGAMALLLGMYSSIPENLTTARISGVLAVLCVFYTLYVPHKVASSKY